MTRLATIFAVFAVFELFVMAPALRLPFFSDDVGYIERNPYVHGLSLENAAVLLDPFGEPARSTANYAPLHLLAHAAEWSLFGPDVVPWHVVNVLVHALAATLLVALFCQRGLPLAVAGVAGAVFLLHPANVETAAWLFQLKTLLALSLALGALLAHPARPLLGLGLFAAALLCKAAAIFALPVAAVFAWLAPPGARARVRWPWLAGWAVAAFAYAVPQLLLFQRAGEVAGPLHPDPLAHARTLVAIGARYLAIAATGIGAAPFHEPSPAVSWLDPWWLAGLVLGALLAARLLVTLAGRREEAAWWTWAAAGYLPVSQLFRFLYPMGDRYLYVVLPGLLGGVIFFARDALVPRLAPRVRANLARLPAGVTPARVGFVAAALLLAFFAERSRAQARVWRSPVSVALATERHYPDGQTAHLLRARRAALRGDPWSAAREVRGAIGRGFDRFMDLEGDRDFAVVLPHPEFQAALREVATSWIETLEARRSPGYRDLYWLGRAHIVREELDAAEVRLLAALEIGGSFDDRIRSDLAALRELRARLAAERGGS